jgi:hypothetical protein
MTTLQSRRFTISRRAKIILVVLGLALLWSWKFPTVTLRYRLTFEVEVDGKVHSGSGIMQAGMYAGPLCGGLGWAPCWSFTGEAVAVDLGARGVLFSLLSGSSQRTARNPTSSWPLPQVEHVQFLPVFAMKRAGLWTRPPGGFAGSVKEWQAAEPLRATVELVPYEIPELVRFRELTDPTTAEIVNPADLAASFGPGVQLKRATLTYVDAGWWPFNALGWPAVLAGEPVTRGIEAQLKWVGNYQLETVFERRLRELGTGGEGSLAPGKKLKRDR